MKRKMEIKKDKNGVRNIDFFVDGELHVSSKKDTLADAFMYAASIIEDDFYGIDNNNIIIALKERKD